MDNNNVDMSKLINILSHMDKKDLEKGVGQLSNILSTNDGKNLVNQLKNTMNNNNGHQ
ncbi:MAG: hypothetical protein J6J36_08840 [Clostridia bacterium]|nr:hypothetical protein [Clostridia bacterium]